MPKSDGYSASTRLLTSPRTSSGGAASVDTMWRVLTRMAARRARADGAVFMRDGILDRFAPPPPLPVQSIKQERQAGHERVLAGGGARGETKVGCEGRLFFL